MNSLTSSFSPAFAARFFLTKLRMSACGVGEAATISGFDASLLPPPSDEFPGSEDVPQAREGESEGGGGREGGGLECGTHGGCLFRVFG